MVFDSYQLLLIHQDVLQVLSVETAKTNLGTGLAPLTKPTEEVGHYDDVVVVVVEVEAVEGGYEFLAEFEEGGRGV